MTDDELEAQLIAVRARVRALEDVEAIKKLHRTYVRARADRQPVLGMFTVDAVVDLRRHGVRSGHAEIAELFGAPEPPGGPRDGQVLSSPVIDVDGDVATGVWTWHGLRASGSWCEGRYRCAYRREEGRWRFASMHFRLVAPDRDTTADESATLAMRR